MIHLKLNMEEGKTIQIADVRCNSSSALSNKAGKSVIDIVEPLILLGQEIIDVSESDELRKSIEQGLLKKLIDKGVVKIYSDAELAKLLSQVKEDKKNDEVKLSESQVTGDNTTDIVELKKEFVSVKNSIDNLVQVLLNQNTKKKSKTKKLKKVHKHGINKRNTVN